MSRHKRRIHTKIAGKFQDRQYGKKSRLNSNMAGHSQGGKTMRRSRNRRTTYLIGK